ncbi:MAG: GNAT family N-acetyltransferase [Actinomycetota bacterium]|nr:GNAT family N-acetyltransferase [Actinomycetota bacterium]
MSFEVRAVELGELDDLLTADQRGFGGEPPRPGASRSWTAAELDRTRVAFESGRMVGVSRTYSFELTMPGGAFLPVAAVSWVSVLPTHRRRGVLTQLMAAMHDDARERDEPAAILTASEGSIYGRYGYGVAAWRLGVTAERARIAFARPDDDEGCTRLVSREEAELAVPAIYERARGKRAGMVTRPDFWWPQVFWEFMFGRSKAGFVAVHADAQGRDDGYVVYDITGDWMGGLPDRRLSVVDMQAESPATWIHLWRYAFGVDLIGTVAASNLPIDDPLRHIVVDSRRVRVDYVNDHLWLAPLDPLAVLRARTYTVPGRLVIETHAPDGARSTVAIEAAADGASCVATTDAPDIVCDSRVLGMCALGGNRWSELADADRLDVRRPEVLPLADAMFLATPAPALLSHF